MSPKCEPPTKVAARGRCVALVASGCRPQAAFVEDLASAYRVDSLDPAGLTRAAEVCRHYRDLELGLGDASIVVLAELSNTHAVATFDKRRFHAVTALDGRAFELFPEP